MTRVRYRPRHPLRLQPERHVVGHRHVREQRVGLQHHADAAPAGGRSVTSRPARRTAARRGPHEPRERVQRGRLARPAWPEQRHRLACGDPQVEVDQRVGRLLAAPVGHSDPSKTIAGVLVRQSWAAVRAGPSGLTRVSAIVSYRWPAGRRPHRRRARRARAFQSGTHTSTPSRTPGGVLASADSGRSAMLEDRDAERLSGRPSSARPRRSGTRAASWRRRHAEPRVTRHVRQRDRGPLAVGAGRE